MKINCVFYDSLTEKLFKLIINTFILNTTENICSLKHNFFWKFLRRKARIHSPCISFSLPTMSQIIKSFAVWLYQNTGPISLGLKKNGVTQVDSIPCTGFYEKSRALLMEVVVNYLGLLILSC